MCSRVAALLGVGDEDLLSKAAGEPADAGELRWRSPVARTADGTVHVHTLWNELLVHELDDAPARRGTSSPPRSCSRRGAYGQAFELLADSQLWAEARALVVDACLDQGHPPGAEQLRRWQSLIPADELGPGPAALIDALVAHADAPWSVDARDHFTRTIAGFAAAGDVLNELGWASGRCTSRGSVRTARRSMSSCAGSTRSVTASPITGACGR